jgi:flagellar biosynthetic protein FliR
MIEALAGLDWVEHVSRFFLLFLRVGGLVAFCPILGSEILPVRLRLSLALVLTLVLLPGASALTPPPADPLIWTAVAVRELAVGFGLGVAARALFDGMEGAARLIAGQSGFALSSMVDPLTGAQSVTPALFQNLLATALFLGADLHHLFIRGLMHSYEVLPAGGGLPAAEGLDEIVGLLGTRLFTVAVELAAPALVVTFAVDLVLVLVGRALPQAPILLIGYPVKMAAGLVGLILLTTTTGAAIGWIGRTFASDGAALLSALGAR